MTTKKEVNAMHNEPPGEIAWCDAQALAKNKAALPDLIKLLDCPDVDVVTAAADALGHIGGDEAAKTWPRLLELLLDETLPTSLRDTCAYALGVLEVREPVVEAALTHISMVATGRLANRCAEASVKIKKAILRNEEE